MGGPAYYSATMNIAKNEDWVVPLVFGTLDTDGVTVIPIDLTGSTLKLELRVAEIDHTAIVAVASPDDGIVLTDAANGAFTIMITRDRLVRLSAGQYVQDLVRLAPSGLQERLWEGAAYVVEGTTR